jgi:hypothetical protein
LLRKVGCQLEEKTTENLPAILDRAERISVQLPGRLDNVANAIFATFSLDSDAGKYMRCKRRADYSSDDVLGKSFYLRNAFGHIVEMVNDQTGEVVPAARVVLETRTGKTLGFVSTGIVQSLNDVLRVFGDGPWDPSPLLTVIQEKTRKGRKTLLLAPCQEGEFPCLDEIAQDDSGTGKRKKS